MGAVAVSFNVLALLGVKPVSTGIMRKAGSGSMESRIALITILTDDVPRLVTFYRDVLGFTTENPRDDMTEFVSEGVRFAICNRRELANATHHPSFSEPARGQAFELAFPCATRDDVDRAYAAVIAKGAVSVEPPATMPWGQRTAFFADPDGNIHELFAD